MLFLSEQEMWQSVTLEAVSYTHLDVYKRQRHFHSGPRPLPGNCPDALPHNQGSGIQSPIPVLSQSPHTVRHLSLIHI